jgi:hypothetical protein
MTPEEAFKVVSETEPDGNTEVYQQALDALRPLLNRPKPDNRFEWDAAVLADVGECRECPMYHSSGYEDVSCDHPSAPADRPPFDSIPDWCPLRKAPLHIRLKP